MIIDVLKTNGVPYRCDYCNTYFVWKPDQSECRLSIKNNNCKKIECRYYEPLEKKCPVCASKDITEIPGIIYKIIKEIRR